MNVMKSTRAVCAGAAVVLCATLASAQEFETPEPRQPNVPNAPTAPVAPVKGGTITGMTGQMANDTVKGAALMDEARKALGGVAKLAAIQRLEFKGVSRRAQGDQALEGDFTIQLEGLDKYKRVEEIAIGGNAGLIIERTEALNGTEAWDNSGGGFPGRGGFPGGGGFQGGGDRGGGGGFRGGGGGFPGGDRGGRGGALGELIGAARGNSDQAGIDPERLKQLQLAQRQQEVARLVLATLLETKGTVAWIGTGQAPEGLADVVEITQPNHPPIRLLLHQMTHMPLMMMWEGPAARGRGDLGRRGGRGARGGDTPPAAAPAASAAAGGPATIQMYLSGYKAVNGVQLPHVISRGSSGLVQEELEVKGYKVNPNFKSNAFVQEK